MRLLKSNRGSILLVTMLFAGAVALFLGIYMTIALNTLQTSNRSIYANAASNLVDTGLDEVMWVMNYNNSKWTGTGGSGFTSANVTINSVSVPGYTKTFDYSGHLSNGVTCKVYVWVNPNASVVLSSGTTTTGTQAVAEAVVTLPATSINSNQSTIIKEAEVFIAPSSYFPGSLVGKTSVKLNGTIDSYNSANGVYGAALSGGKTNINAKASAGSPDVVNNAVVVGQATIAGNVLTGESSSAVGDMTVGAKGSVGDSAWIAAGKTGIETGHATYNFTTSFPDVTTPTATTINNTLATGISGGTTLPAAGDKGVTVNGVTTYYYNVDSISLSGKNDVVNIGASSSSKANVVIFLTNSTTDVSITGNGALNIASGSTLVMYAPGSVAIGGKGMINGNSTATATDANPPSAFQLYGTQTAAQIAAGSAAQTISVAGNGDLSGAVYAPNASITMSGGGSSGGIFGAMVGNTVDISGGKYPFHYDESLANLNNSSNLWATTKYRELFTSSDRAVYAACFPSS